MEVVWSLTAAKSYRKNLEYLKEEWSVNEIENFINIVDRAIVTISKNPEIGRRSDVSQHYRQFIIIKQITLYYRVTSHNIRLVCFFNNYQDPEKLKEFLT